MLDIINYNKKNFDMTKINKMLEKNVLSVFFFSVVRNAIKNHGGQRCNIYFSTWIDSRFSYFKCIMFHFKNSKRSCV